MNIGIDGYEANVSERVGIGRYAFEILTRLNKLTSSHRVTVFLPNPSKPEMPAESERWHYQVVKPQKFWTFVGLPLAIKRHRLDVMFSPTHYIPRFVDVPRVMSIMDLSYLKFPDMFRKKDLYQLVNWTSYSASRAARILTISQASKNDIIKAYHVPESKVVVTYPGLTMSSKTPGTPRLPKNYILSVGTLQPRKNYVRLIQAFSLFLKENRQKFSDVKLLIIGKRGWLYEEILAAPRAYGVEDRVTFLDFVPDSDLPVYYKNALCFALPSLYEGFGLPVLEAMSQKCPVVVSNVSSLPEIAGKAAVYVDPQNTESIKNGLLTAVRQRNLVQGKSRLEEGVKRSKTFTWDEAAKKTLWVLEDVGGAA